MDPGEIRLQTSDQDDLAAILRQMILTPPDPLFPIPLRPFDSSMFLEAEPSYGEVKVERPWGVSDSSTTVKASSIASVAPSTKMDVESRVRSILGGLKAKKIVADDVPTPSDAQVAFWVLSIVMSVGFLLAVYVWLGKWYANLLADKRTPLTRTRRLMRDIGDVIFQDSIWKTVVFVVRLPILMWKRIRGAVNPLPSMLEAELGPKNDGLISPNLSILRQGYEPV